MIHVTRPYLPPLQEFLPYLEKIWDSRILTNNGPYHKELELALCEYLNVPYVTLFSNATTALLSSFKALDLKGQVITTPFSFIATASSLLWSNLEPVFIDIDPLSYNIDPNLIADAITPKTCAILGVHCYGAPCAVHEIEHIARKYNLQIIYDAAHSFGARYENQSLLSYGDVSVTSFHATKVFHTFEGGAVISHQEKHKEKLELIKNFGIAGEHDVIESGINGKMNEMEAAVGLIQLKYIDNVIKLREEVSCYYTQKLSQIEGLILPRDLPGLTSNNSYYPIQITSDCVFTCEELYTHLRKNGIHARRYFYPLITETSYYKSNKQKYRCGSLKHARDIAATVLCLPIYPEMSLNEQNFVLEKILLLNESIPSSALMC